MGLWDSCPNVVGNQHHNITTATSNPNGTYTDLLTFAFRGPVPYDPERPLFIDAENPSRSFNARQFETLVRTLIAGLKAHHVQRGDCVLVHLGNSVSAYLLLRRLSAIHPSLP